MQDLEFSYPQKQIGSIAVLAKTLSISEHELVKIAKQSDKYYKVAKRIPKPNGDERLTFRVIYPLKGILERLRNRIINNVQMPNYILAGRQGKSYIDNAKQHKRSVMVLSEDITRFFDSIKIQYVINIFKYLFKFPQEVAETISLLCTYNGKLVQGSPVSGDIANLVFFQKEPKLVQFANSLNLEYSRYYDDIYISSKHDSFYDNIHELKAIVYGMFASVEVKPNRSPKKSRIMRSSARIDVHNVTVNSHKISPSKERVASTRLLVHKLQNLINNKSSVEEVITLYKKTIGQIMTLKAQESTKYKSMLTTVYDAIKLIDEPKAKKYCRKLRKAKDIKQLNKLSQKVSVLKKVSPAIAAVIKAELKSARVKLKRKAER